MTPGPGEGVIRVTLDGIQVEAWDLEGHQLTLGFKEPFWHTAEDLEHVACVLSRWLDLPRGTELENHDHSHLMGERRVP